MSHILNLKKQYKRVQLLSFLVIWVHGLILAQEAASGDPINVQKRNSQIGMATKMVGDTYVKLTYGRPLKGKAKIVFGYKIPFKKLWRFGDDDATELTVTKPVSILGNRLAEGIYALFAIPGKEEWTIIVNSQPGQWGHFKYDKSKDVFRFQVPVHISPKDFDQLSFYMENSDKGVDIVMIWNFTAIRIPIEV